MYKRQAVGPEIQLLLDVHTRLDTAHAVQLCRDLEEFKPYFLEDLLRSENQGGYRNLRRQVNVPIAAGEQWASKWSFRQVIEEDLIDYARIDLCLSLIHSSEPTRLRRISYAVMPLCSSHLAQRAYLDKAALFLFEDSPL